jgi:2,4-dienoyl-CoA reductase-like NADH-dependent reductase (Old Yellow Enzyme family)
MRDLLLSPGKVGSLELPNRIVMGPLTRMRASADGVMGAMNAEYYCQRATAGLIVSEGVYPNINGKSYPGQPGLETPEQVEGWRLVTDAVHGAGGRIFAQVMHGGRISHERIIGGLEPVAPSAVRADEMARVAGEKLPLPTPRAIATEEIALVAEQYASASANAIQASQWG